MTAVLLPACIGDRSIQVTFENDTHESLTVYPFGKKYPDWHWSLAPDQTLKNSLLAGDAKPESFVARVEGFDESGSLVFCHGYTYGELTRLSGVIHLRKGVLDC